MGTLSNILEDKRAIEMALMDNGGELTPEIEEALAITDKNLTAKIDGYHSIIMDMEFGDAEIDKEIKRLQALKKTKANAQKRLKAYLLGKMQEFDIKNINGVLCKVFRKATTESLVIEDEAALLAKYGFMVEEFKQNLPVWVKVDLSIDKTAFKNHIHETGIIPSGVSLSKGETIIFK